MKRFWFFLIFLTFSLPAFAVGSIIAAEVFLLVTATGALTTTGLVVAFAINMVVSTIISKALAPSLPNVAGGADSLAGGSPNPGNRQQLPPATDNKLPVVYGSAYVGGAIVDLSITSDNQTLYYVLALSEVTNSNPGGATDNITFGNIYWGGKRCNLIAGSPEVVSLVDESTGLVDNSVGGKLFIYLYSNGSNQPVNSTQTAIQVMSDSSLTYKWDSSKLMTNCAFAIIKIKYSQSANLVGMQQTKFQVINSRYKPGDCFYDYLTNQRYGAALAESDINLDSLTELNTYCAESFSYTDFNNNPQTQERFRFDGVLDTNRSIMQNLQDMTASCDCLLKYNEIEGKWGVITQKPSYTVAMDINDSNMISAIQITPMDLASSFNIAEVKFPDNSAQDAFNSATFDLSVIAPELLFPNEPVNKQSLSLPLVNNSVRAQYLATRFLKTAREDLQLTCSVNYVGLQLEAGDIVTVTNSNYGWSAKPFRLTKVSETFNDDGSIIVTLLMTEFNSSVYNDYPITQFTPAPNTGIPSPTFFGTLYPPSISNQFPTAAVPYFLVNVTASSSGIVQYAEIWYSAFQTPTNEQLIFAGLTAIQPSGLPYPSNSALPPVALTNVPLGNWYFFVRMVNGIGSSPFSNASSLFRWRPSTFQFSERYVVVAYADTQTGGGFSLDPRNKSYYGLLNQNNTSPSINANDYSWYLAEPTFGTTVYLAYAYRGERKFSFDTSTATEGFGRFVPSDTTNFDISLWQCLEDGTNFIDLDYRSGQLIEYGGTTVSNQDGLINVTNNAQGKLTAALNPFLSTQFGPGVYSKTSSVALLTVDVYGRVIGFEEPDAFYYTITVATATSGQTVFPVTRAAGYINGQCLVFENGCLLNPSEYTDAITGVTFPTGRTAGDIISIISVKSSNTTSGVYASFTRNSATLTNVSSYTASGFTLNSGYEMLFLNGTIVNDQDYDIIGQTITNFPDVTTGNLEIIQWSVNNLSQPAGGYTAASIFTTIGQATYPYSFDPNAFNLFDNGVLLKAGTDYTTSAGSYTLTTTPDSVLYVLVQNTFQRTGAV